MTDGFFHALSLLPADIRAAGEALPEAERGRAEEFRLRSGQAPTVLAGGRERALLRRRVTEGDLRAVLDAATQSSFHSAAPELRRGFINARAGVRVGVCGAVAAGEGDFSLRELFSAAIRIPRQMPGVGAEAIARLGVENVLILSPPGGGKTTFLRELVRSVSDAGTRVGVADERGELAAASEGGAAFDVGRHTDVLTGAPKAEAAMVLLRAMNPQVIALDEVSAPEDIEAVLRIAGCGVRVFATAHAASAAELAQRPLYRRLLDEHMFRRAVVIRQGAARRYEVAAL